MEDFDKLPARAIVGIDTGGTFTDVTLLDQMTGRIWTAKTPSTPHVVRTRYQCGTNSTKKYRPNKYDSTNRF